MMIFVLNGGESYLAVFFPRCCDAMGRVILLQHQLKGVGTKADRDVAYAEKCLPSYPI